MPKPYLVEYELDWAKHHKKNNRVYTSQQRQNRTILEKLIADPSEAPSSSAAIRKCNRHDDIEQKIGYSFQEMKTIASSNMSRLQTVISQMDAAGDARSHGIGSGGGHIARLMKDPGPTNGHYIMAVEDPFNRKTVAEMTAELLPKIRLENGKELNLPEWNHRFLEGGNVLNKYDCVTDSTPERLTRISSFRQEILKYRVSTSEVSKSDPSFSKTKTKKGLRRGSASKEGGGVPAARSTDSLDDEFDSEEESLRSMDSKQPVTLVMLAEELWKTLMRELKESAHSIQYSDLIEINALREPPEMVVNCIGYICLLLDLEPTWQSARCALFKEFRPFQNFLREVDPLSLPIKRIRAAFNLKAEKLHHVTIHALATVCRPLAKIMRWVIAFNNIAQLIIAVETRKEASRGDTASLGIAAAATATGGGGKSDVSTSSQHTTGTKKAPTDASTTAAGASHHHHPPPAHPSSHTSPYAINSSSSNNNMHNKTPHPHHHHHHDSSDDVSTGTLSSAGLPPEIKTIAGDVIPIAENLARFFQDLSQEQATLQAYYSRKDLSLYQEWVRQCKHQEMQEAERLAEEEEYEAEGFDQEEEASPEQGKEAKAAAGADKKPSNGTTNTTTSSASGKVKKAGSVGSSAKSKKQQLPLSRGGERHRSTGSIYTKLPAVSASAEDNDEDWLLEALSKPPTTATTTTGNTSADTNAANTNAAAKNESEQTEKKNTPDVAASATSEEEPSEGASAAILGEPAPTTTTTTATTPTAEKSPSHAGKVSKKKSPGGSGKKQPSSASAAVTSSGPTPLLAHKHKIISASVEALISSIDANGGVLPSRVHVEQPSHSNNNGGSGAVADLNVSKTITTGERSRTASGKRSKKSTTGRSVTTSTSAVELPRITSAPSSESLNDPAKLMVNVPKDGPAATADSGNNYSNSNSSGELDKKLRRKSETRDADDDGYNDEFESEEAGVTVEVVSPIAQLIRQSSAHRSPKGAKRTTLSVSKSPTSDTEGAGAAASGGAGAGAAPSSAKQSQQQRLRIGTTSPEALKKAHPSTLKSRDQLNPLIVLTKPPKPEPTPSALPEHIPALAKLKPKAKANLEKSKGTPINSLTAMHPVAPKTRAAKAGAAKSSSPVPDASLEALLAEMEEAEPQQKAKKTDGAGAKKTPETVSKSPEKPKTATSNSANASTVSASGPGNPGSSGVVTAAPASPQQASSGASPKRAGSSSSKKKPTAAAVAEECEDEYGEDEYEEYGNEEYEPEEGQVQREGKKEEPAAYDKAQQQLQQQRSEDKQSEAAAKPITTAVSPRAAIPSVADPRETSAGASRVYGDEKGNNSSNNDSKAESKSSEAASVSAVMAPSAAADAKDSASSSSATAEGKYSYKDTPASHKGGSGGSELDDTAASGDYKRDDKNSSNSSSSGGGNTSAAPVAEVKAVKSLHLQLDEFVLPSPSDLAGSSASVTPATGGGAGGGLLLLSTVSAASVSVEVVSGRLSVSESGGLANQSVDSLDVTAAWNHADNIKVVNSANTKPTPASSVYSAAVSTRSLENELDSMFVFDTPKAAAVGSGAGASAVSLSLDNITGNQNSSSGVASSGGSSGISCSSSGGSSKRSSSPKKASTAATGSPPERVNEEQEQEEEYEVDFDEFEP